MLHTLFSARPELAIFLALSVGYAAGSIKTGMFKLGGVAGTLLAALLIGQVGVQIDPSLQRFMFTLFIYALGFSVAPQFFASVDRTTWTWTLLVAVEVTLILTVVFVAAYLFKLDVGTASGLLAGAATESALVGTASEAIGRLGLSTEVAQAFQANVATAYALSYIFGLITIVLFTSQAAPKLLRIDLRAEARRVLAKLGGVDQNLDTDQSSSFPSLVSRGFRVMAAAGKTVSTVEGEFGGGATIESVKRGNAEIPVNGACVLDTGDEVAVSGLRTAMAAGNRVIGAELGDPADVKFIIETRDVVLTHRPMHLSAIADIVTFLRTADCRGVYLAGIKRMDRVLPPLPGSVVRLGDVLRLFGKPEDVSRAAHLLGKARDSQQCDRFRLSRLRTRHWHFDWNGDDTFRRGIPIIGKCRRASVWSCLRLATFSMSDLRKVSVGSHADIERPGAGRLHRFHRTDVRSQHSCIAGNSRLAAADCGNLPVASAATGFALYRPLCFAYRAGHTVWRDRRSARQYAGYKCYRSRCGQSSASNWLHGNLRNGEHFASAARTYLCGGICCHTYDSSVDRAWAIDFNRHVKATLLTSR